MAARYLFPAKTIGYSQLLSFNYTSILIWLISIFIYLLFGLRGNAPMISLRGNSLYYNGDWYLLDEWILVMKWISIIDVRLWGCDDDHEWNVILRGHSTIYPILSLGWVIWDMGGGGNGIGGIKWKAEKLEFCEEGSLKKCTKISVEPRCDLACASSNPNWSKPEFGNRLFVRR